MDHNEYQMLMEIIQRLDQIQTEVSTIREALFETTETKAEKEYKEGITMKPRLTQPEE